MGVRAIAGQKAANLILTIYCLLLSVFFRHLSLQYFTPGQFFAHFFLHTMGLPQAAHFFSGKYDLLPRCMECINKPDVIKFWYAVNGVFLYWALSKAGAECSVYARCCGWLLNLVGAGENCPGYWSWAGICGAGNGC